MRTRVGCRAKRFFDKAGTAGGSALREDLVQPLQELHHDIHATIDAEVLLPFVTPFCLLSQLGTCRI